MMSYTDLLQSFRKAGITDINPIKIQEKQKLLEKDAMNKRVSFVTLEGSNNIQNLGIITPFTKQNLLKA